MQMTVDLLRASDGRLEGTLVTDTGDRVPFSGTLDLLRLLEELTEPPHGAVPGDGRR
jgi:hypothetical protein